MNLIGAMISWYAGVHQAVGGDSTVSGSEFGRLVEAGSPIFA
jgi:hypothetical protein